MTVRVRPGTPKETSPKGNVFFVDSVPKHPPRQNLVSQTLAGIYNFQPP